VGFLNLLVTVCLNMIGPNVIENLDVHLHEFLLGYFLSLIPFSPSRLSILMCAQLLLLGQCHACCCCAFIAELTIVLLQRQREPWQNLQSGKLTN